MSNRSDLEQARFAAARARNAGSAEARAALVQEACAWAYIAWVAGQKGAASE